MEGTACRAIIAERNAVGQGLAEAHYSYKPGRVRSEPQFAPAMMGQPTHRYVDRLFEAGILSPF
jgi:hypothetical protein